MTREEWLRLSAILGIGSLLPIDTLGALSDNELKRSDFGARFCLGHCHRRLPG